MLKGPAGILYQGGFGPVGGIINSVSKLPTATASAEAGVMAGGFGVWNPWFDVNGPLDKGGNVLFRMTADFQRSRDYIDVIERRRRARQYLGLAGERVTLPKKGCVTGMRYAAVQGV